MSRKPDLVGSWEVLPWAWGCCAQEVCPSTGDDRRCEAVSEAQLRAQASWPGYIVDRGTQAASPLTEISSEISFRSFWVLHLCWPSLFNGHFVKYELPF